MISWIKSINKMISFKPVPVHPFWRFSVRIYSQTHVKNSMLTLQNERGLNVNVLLFCIWYGSTDQGRLSKLQFRNLLNTIQHWHDQIVVPLRRTRQRLKSVDSNGWQDIRQEIGQHEIVAEQIEQLIMLENLVLSSKPAKNNVQRIVDICKNIATYYHVMHISCDARDSELVAGVLHTLFPKIDQKNILRYCMQNLVVKELQSVKLKAQLLLDL